MYRLLGSKDSFAINTNSIHEIRFQKYIQTMGQHKVHENACHEKNPAWISIFFITKLAFFLKKEKIYLF